MSHVVFRNLTPQKVAKAGGYPDHSRPRPEDGKMRPKDAAHSLIANAKLRSSASRPAKQLVPDSARQCVASSKPAAQFLLNSYFFQGAIRAA